MVLYVKMWGWETPPPSPPGSCLLFLHAMCRERTERDVYEQERRLDDRSRAQHGERTGYTSQNSHIGKQTSRLPKPASAHALSTDLRMMAREAMKDKERLLQGSSRLSDSAAPSRVIMVASVSIPFQSQGFGGTHSPSMLSRNAQQLRMLSSLTPAKP